MENHIRIFDSNENFLAAQRVLDDEHIKYSVVTKPEKLPGKCDKGIAYAVSDGTRIWTVLLNNEIESRCFSMAVGF